MTLVGDFYGDKEGGSSFDDARDCSLTFDDRIVAITGRGSMDKINYVTFSYSNKKSTLRGEKPDEQMTQPYQLKLKPDEYIDAVTVYTSIRLIPNPYKPNGTFFVVGLRFHTNRGQEQLFGSEDGTSKNETFRNYQLGYIRGRAHGYVDAIQLIWYRETARTASATLPPPQVSN